MTYLKLGSPVKETATLFQVWSPGTFREHLLMVLKYG